MLENGVREVAPPPQLVCPNQTYSSAHQVSMSTHRDASGGAEHLPSAFPESWWLWEPASLTNGPSPPSPPHRIFQMKLWKSWCPNRNLPPCRNVSLVADFLHSVHDLLVLVYF